MPLKSSVLKVNDGRFLAVILTHKEFSPNNKKILAVEKFKNICLNVYAITSRPATCYEALDRLELRGLISIHKSRKRNYTHQGRVIILDKKISLTEVATAIGIPWIDLGEIILTQNVSRLKEVFDTQPAMNASNNMNLNQYWEKSTSNHKVKAGVPLSCASMKMYTSDRLHGTINPNPDREACFNDTSVDLTNTEIHEQTKKRCRGVTDRHPVEEAGVV